VPSLRRRYRNKADLAAAVIGSLRVEEPPADAPDPALAILGSLLAEEERHPELLHLFKTRIVEPRRALLRQALAAGDLPGSADLPVFKVRGVDADPATGNRPRSLRHLTWQTAKARKLS
jgi:hypothetical protein